MKKLKEADKQPALKKKGHQKQFQFNEDVCERLTEASAAIHQMPAAVERAKTAIQEGMDQIVARTYPIMYCGLEVYMHAYVYSNAWA